MSWSVVATVRAPENRCRRFVQHYLALGAEHIYIYQDDPNVAVELAGARVTSTLCGDEWWASRKGGRPEALEERQCHNATMAKQICNSTWILHCDVDELVHAARPIAEVLAEMPDTVGGVKISPVEAVYETAPLSEEDVFLTPWFKAYTDPQGREKAYREFSKIAYGNVWSATKCGFWGHTVGKSFIRNIPAIKRMPLHQASPEIDGLRLREPCREIILRHYDSATFFDWKDKHLRRIHRNVVVPQAGKHRAAQEILIKNAFMEAGEEGLRNTYELMATLPSDVLAQGRDIGFVLSIPPEPHLVGR